MQSPSTEAPTIKVVAASKAAVKKAVKHSSKQVAVGKRIGSQLAKRSEATCIAKCEGTINETAIVGSHVEHAASTPQLHPC